MVELKPGMTVWDRQGNARVVVRSDAMGRVFCKPVRGLAWTPARRDVSLLDPASPAGQALAALERHADGVTTYWIGVDPSDRWHATLRRDSATGGFLARLETDGADAEATGPTPQAAVAALRDQLEAAVVAAWEREHA